MRLIHVGWNCSALAVEDSVAIRCKAMLPTLQILRIRTYSTAWRHLGVASENKVKKEIKYSILFRNFRTKFSLTMHLVTFRRITSSKVVQFRVCLEIWKRMEMYEQKWIKSEVKLKIYTRHEYSPNSYTSHHNNHCTKLNYLTISLLLLTVFFSSSSCASSSSEFESQLKCSNRSRTIYRQL